MALGAVLGAGILARVLGGAGVPAAAPPEPPELLSVRALPGGGGWRVEHRADPDGYFVGFAGPTVRDLQRPVAMALGTGPTGVLEEAFTAGPVEARFLRVGRFPLAAPLDHDRDGIDDVFELRHARVLNPLDPLDAGRDADGDGRSNLTEYREGTDPESGPWVGGPLWVVDEPPSGSAVHFRTLSAALAHLRGALPAGATGRVIVATATPQTVDGWDLDGGLDLEVGEGFAGRVVLRGPGAAPLAVNARGGLGLQGLAIENPGGVTVAAGGRLVIRACRLPGVVVGMGSGAEAGAGSARAGGRNLADGGGGGASVTVADNVFTGPLQLNWFGSAQADAVLGVTGNSVPGVGVSVRGTFGGQALLQGNVTRDVAVSFEALAAAQVILSDMANLETLSLTGEASGNPTLTLSHLLAGTVNVRFGGVGTVFATLGDLTSRTLTLDFGGAGSDSTLANLNLDDFALRFGGTEAGPTRGRHRQENVRVKGGIRIDAWDAEGGELDLSLASVNASTLELRSRAFTRLELAEGVTLTGRLEAVVDGDLLRWGAVGARLEGGVEVRAAGVGAGIWAYWQGGTVRGRADFVSESGVFSGLTVDATVFEPGGLLAIRSGSGPSRPVPASATPAAAGDGIVLRRIREAPGTVLIAGTASPVTVESCVFAGGGLLPVLILEDVRGAVRIDSCQFRGSGLGISAGGGEVELNDNRIELASAVAPAIGIDAAGATLRRNTVTGTGVSGLGLRVTGRARIEDLDLGEGLGLTLESGDGVLEGGRVGGPAMVLGGRWQANGVAFGDVVMVSGEGRIGWTACPLAGVPILDLTEAGGLLGDPTREGARPEDVFSPIDFDGDPQHCADYPPPQRREDTGDCVRPGVPPPP